MRQRHTIPREKWEQLNKESKLSILLEDLNSVSTKIYAYRYNASENRYELYWSPSRIYPKAQLFYTDYKIDNLIDRVKLLIKYRIAEYEHYE